MGSTSEIINKTNITKCHRRSHQTAGNQRQILPIRSQIITVAFLPFIQPEELTHQRQNGNVLPKLRLRRLSPQRMSLRSAVQTAAPPCHQRWPAPTAIASAEKRCQTDLPVPDIKLLDGDDRYRVPPRRRSFTIPCMTALFRHASDIQASECTPLQAVRNITASIQYCGLRMDAARVKSFSPHR